MSQDSLHPRRGQHSSFPGAVDAPIIKIGPRAESFNRRPLKIQVPHQFDGVFFTAAGLLEQYNAQSFAHAEDPLCIEALSAAPSLYLEYESLPEVHLLTRHELFVLVQLKLTVGGTIIVLINGVWHEFSKWLQTLPGPDTVFSLGPAGYRAQYRRLRRSGKPFRFIELPQEIQERIMLFTMGARIEPFGYTGGAISIQEPTSCGYFTDRVLHKHQPMFMMESPQVDRLDTAILALNRQLSPIALNVLHKHTTKVFRATFDYPKELDDMRSFSNSGAHENLVHVELALSPRQLIDMFGVELAPFKHMWTHPGRPEIMLAQYLKSLRMIKSLEIVVCSFDSDWILSSWVRNFDRQPIINNTMAYSYLEFDREPCRKVLMEWILPYMYQYIKHIPSVRLNGQVKTSTKVKWEAIFNDKTVDDHADYVEGLKQEVRPLRNEQVPPHCYCPQKCNIGIPDHFDVDDRAQERQHD